MTIHEAITRADILMPNQYTDAEKIRWLSELDGQAKQEIFDRCEGSPADAFTGYAEDTDTDTALLIAPPYDGVYVDLIISLSSSLFSSVSFLESRTPKRFLFV